MVRLVIVLFAAITCVSAFTSSPHALGSFTTTSSLHPSPQAPPCVSRNRMVPRSNTRIMMTMIPLSDTNYKKLLVEGEIVLVDACAQWCGPCKLIEPVLDRCMEKWKGTLHMVKLDVEDKHCPNVKLEFLLQNVLPKSLPCLILFKDGLAIAKHNGIITEKELDEFIETNLNLSQGTTTTISTFSQQQQRNDQGGGTVLVASPKKKQTGRISLSQNDSDNDYMLSNF